MKRLDCSQCRVHVLVCANERPSPQVCCKQSDGEKIFDALKSRVLRQGLAATHWITRTGCLGFCHADGSTVVIQHPGKPALWYHQVTLDDFEALWSEIVD